MVQVGITSAYTSHFCYGISFENRRYIQKQSNRNKYDSLCCCIRGNEISNENNQMAKKITDRII